MFGTRSEPDPELTADAQDAGTEARATVLLIDDDPEYVEVTAGLLRSAGFSVLTSNTAAKGLNMVQYSQCDLRVVLLDCDMPQLDGAQAAAYLRRLSPQVKLVGVTGLAPGEVPKPYQSQLDALLFKPVQSDQLFGLLHAVLGQPQTPGTRATAT